MLREYYVEVLTDSDEKIYKIHHENCYFYHTGNKKYELGYCYNGRDAFRKALAILGKKVKVIGCDHCSIDAKYYDAREDN